MSPITRLDKSIEHVKAMKYVRNWVSTESKGKKVKSKHL
jgi:hypothetical protein